MRKGQNPNVTDDRNVYLLLITEGDNQHVALIPNIQSFLNATNSYHYKNPSFCPICCVYVQPSKYEMHVSNCLNLNSESKVELPQNKIYKFKKHISTEMCPLICVFDTETMLIPDETSDTSILNSHEIAAYCYSFLDQDGNHVLTKRRIRESMDENLPEELVSSILEDYKSLMSEIEASWYGLYMTEEDILNFENATNFGLCDREFLDSSKSE